MRIALLLLLVLLVPVVSGAIYINEIVPNPEDDCRDCTEWLELYNDGDEVDIASWLLNDSAGNYIYIDLNYSAETTITKNGYLVLSNFSYGFKLRNKEDTISLYHNGELIDQVSYSGFSTKSSYDLALARLPDGSENWVKTASTPSESNRAEKQEEEQEETTKKDDKIIDAESVAIKEVSKQEEKIQYNPELTGKTVYISEQKESLTKPLLLLLLGLLVIIVAMQMQLTQRDG